MRRTRPPPPVRSTRSLLLGRGRRCWRRIGRLDVVPAERVLVVQHGIRVAVLRRGPLAASLEEQRPVGLALREALAVLRGLVVDLAYSRTEAELLDLVLDPGLVHQRLAVDCIGAEPDARLNRCAGQVLDHHVRVTWRGRVDAGGWGRCSRRRRTSACAEY